MLKEIPNSEEILYDPKKIVYMQDLSVSSSIEDRYAVSYNAPVSPVVNSINLSCKSINLEYRECNINLVFSVKEFLERFDSIVIDGVVFKKEEN